MEVASFKKMVLKNHPPSVRVNKTRHFWPEKDPFFRWCRTRRPSRRSNSGETTTGRASTRTTRRTITRTPGSIFPRTPIWRIFRNLRTSRTRRVTSVLTLEFSAMTQQVSRVRKSRLSQPPDTRRSPSANPYTLQFHSHLRLRIYQLISSSIFLDLWPHIFFSEVIFSLKILTFPFSTFFVRFFVCL